MSFTIFKTKLTTILASGLLSLAIALPSFASSEKMVALIDTQVILEKSVALQKVREQLDKKAEEFKKDSSSKEAYFKKKYEDLEKQKTVLSKEAFEQKSNDLAKEFADAQKKVQESRTVLDKAYSDSMQQFEKVLTEVVKDEAVKVGTKVVLPKMHTLYGDQSLDMTTPVLENLNKKLPNIAVKF